MNRQLRLGVLCVVVAALGLACGGSPAVGGSAPQAPRGALPAAASASSAAAAVPIAPAVPSFSEPREPAVLALDAPLPPFTAAPPPAHCARLRATLPSGAGPTLPACATPEAVLAALDEALAPLATSWAAWQAKKGTCFKYEFPSPWEAQQELAARVRERVSRDAKLAALERCAALPAGWVRTLRASLLPECADVLARAPLERRAALAPRFVHALQGLAVAARLGSLDTRPPAFRGRSAALTEVEPYLARQFKPWMVRERARIDELGNWAHQLPADSQGGATARIALADAESSFMGRARGLAIPPDWKKDEGQREAFYRALVAALEGVSGARRVARDEAVPAMAIAALLPRRGTWRTANANRLDDLLAPATPVPLLDTRDVRLAIAVPSGLLLDLWALEPGAVRDHDAVAAALHAGGAPELRRAVAEANELSALELLGRAELLIAAASVDPARAASAAARLASVPGVSTPERDLLIALALDLAALPADAGAEAARPTPQATHLVALADRDSNALVAWLAPLDAGLLVSLGDDEAATALFRRASERRPPGESVECEWLAEGSRPAFLSDHGCPCPHVLRQQ